MAFKGFPGSGVNNPKKKTKLYEPTRQKRTGPYSSGLPKNINNFFAQPKNVKGFKRARKANGR